MGNRNSAIGLSKFVLPSGVVVFADRDSTLFEVSESEFSEIDSANLFCVPPDPDGGIVALRVWPGALRAAKHEFFEVKFVNVLELGCGVGLLGLSLAKRYFPNVHVTLTDRASVQPVVAHAIIANNLSSYAVFEAFDWGSSSDLARFSARAFDLIIASEVVYAEEMEPLLNALVAATTVGSPQIVLQYTERSEEDKKYLEIILEKFPNIRLIS